MHTTFAMASDSYSQPSLYLRRILKDVPELPLVNVHPKYFYRKVETYEGDVERLAEYLEANPKDADALFIMGYIKWRDERIVEATELLGRAIANTTSEELKEAVRTLLDGMTASGKLVQRKMPEIKMTQGAEYATAGIEFALPIGFQRGPLRDSSQIIRATRDTGTETAQSFSAQIFPVSRGVTPKAFLDFMVELVQQKLPIRDLKTTAEGEVSFPGIDAYAQSVTYSHRGIDSAAVAVCFVREVSEPDATPATEPIRLAYLLVAETTQAQSHLAGPTVAKVLETVSFVDLRRPIDMPIDSEGAALEDLRLGYTIRRPTGWSVQRNETGLVMGQVDFSLGGIASPEVKVVALSVPDTWTPKSFGEDAIKRKTEEGYEMKVLAQGPVKLAGKDGYQFVVRKTMKAVPGVAGTLPTAPIAAPQAEASFVEIGRLILVPATEGEKRLYAIVLDSHNCTVEQAEAVMDKIASGFSLSEPGDVPAVPKD
jgi:hypothetical protein